MIQGQVVNIEEYVPRQRYEDVVRERDAAHGALKIAQQELGRLQVAAAAADAARRDAEADLKELRGVYELRCEQLERAKAIGKEEIVKVATLQRERDDLRSVNRALQTRIETLSGELLRAGVKQPAPAFHAGQVVRSIVPQENGEHIRLRIVSKLSGGEYWVENLTHTGYGSVRPETGLWELER